MMQGSAGMTIREYFAARAMQGILSRSLRPNSRGNESTSWAITSLYGPQTAAKLAVEYADYLIQELAK